MKLQPTTLISVIASLLASIPVSGGSSIGIKRTLYNDTSDANHLQHAKRKLLSGKYLQLVDHTNTKLGSFPQHFWIDRQYYNAKMDSPVFLFLVEDHDPDSRQKHVENTIIRALVEKHEATIIYLQLRYHGKSYPYKQLSEKHLKYLTTDQIVSDIVRFANDVEFEDLRSPKLVPWVLIGGGYSGGLVSWVFNKFPVTFAAGYSSSGKVQAKTDFWEFYDGIRRNMPQECARNVQRVVKYFDNEVKSGRDVADLKEALGFPDIKHISDVAQMMADELSNWIDVDYVTRPNETTRFGEFCDVINKGGGGNISKLLEAWRGWNQEHCDSICQKWDTYNTEAPMYKDLEDKRRSWKWPQCNEYGWLRTAPHALTNPIISQELTLARELRICRNYFPRTYLSKEKLARPGPAVDETNANYGGWEKLSKNVFFAVGQFDTAYEISVLATKARPDFEEGSVAELNRGHHQSDLVPEEEGRSLGKAHEVAQTFIASRVEKWWEDEKIGAHRMN